MKAFTILPAVAAAILALNISSASSQVACQRISGVHGRLRQPADECHAGHLLHLL